MNVGNSVSDQFPFGKLSETVYLDTFFAILC